MSNSKKEKQYKRAILALSIAIPIVVALLFRVRIPDVAPLTFLPPVYATINGITAVLLVAAVIAIKKGQRSVHEKLNTTAIIFSVLFLIMYVAYHMTSDPTEYGGKGTLKYVYYFVLISHILLSVLVIPFVLYTYMRAKLGDFAAHKRIAKITFPLWLYVATTGVIVYLMISPYYA